MTDNILDAAGATPHIASQHAATSKRRWLIALVLMLLVITGYLDRISIAVLFTNTDFQNAMGTGFNPALLGMLMTAFFVTYGLSSLLLSFTGDRFGPRKMLISGSLIWGALMLLMGSVSSYASMLASRIALGLFEGPQFSWILKVVSRWFPSGERGRANSIWLLGSPLGSAIGFPSIIFLVANYGWRNAFWILGFLSILVMAPLLWAIVVEKPDDSQTPKAPAPTLSSIWRGSSSYLRSGAFWLLTIFDCGELIYLWGLNSWLPTYLQRARHFDVQHLGFYSSLPFVLLFIGEITSGFLSDRFERKAPLLFIGLTVASALLYVATIVDSPTSAALLIALSAGFCGLAIPATYVLSMKIIPSEVTASGIGVLNGIANTVGALAPLAMGLVIGATNSMDSGLYVLICGSLICSCAILPLLGKH
ncbi:MAG: MFS transporter [Proteobacteria bacterium]|nr:MFS transporter [Pseudomonadota bacterium]